MHLTLIAVGRAKAGPTKDLFELYQKRLDGLRRTTGWSLSLKEVEERKNLPAEQLKKRESELLQAACPPGALIVALDETGTDLTSTGFAEQLRRWQDTPVSQLCFLIGGADGLDKHLKDNADATLCLGRMTWPHLLVRGLLAEQLYRAGCLLCGHPYHKK